MCRYRKLTNRGNPLARTGTAKTAMKMNIGVSSTYADFFHRRPAQKIRSREIVHMSSWVGLGLTLGRLTVVWHGFTWFRLEYASLHPLLFIFFLHGETVRHGWCDVPMAWYGVTPYGMASYAMVSQWLTVTRPGMDGTCPILFPCCFCLSCSSQLVFSCWAVFLVFFPSFSVDVCNPNPLYISFPRNNGACFFSKILLYFVHV